MKGWVYVISNKAIPGLIKVGYSMQDPELRARDLDNTGTPHPYVVEYEILIEEPYEIEQKAHQYLSSYLEGKEWFRCTPEEAVAAIQRVAEGRAIQESFKKAKREEVEKLHREREAANQREIQKRKMMAELQEKELQIISRYQVLLVEKFPKPGLKKFLLYYFGFFWASLIGIGLLVVECKLPIGGDGIVISTIVAALIFSFLYRNHVIRKQQESDQYREIVKTREGELEVVRKERGQL